MTNALRLGQRRRRGVFLRQIELNWVGWSALVVGSCVLGAGCVALASVGHWPWLPALVVGVLGVPVCLVVPDRRTWRNGYTYTGMSADAAELTHVSARLRDLGYDVTMDLDTQDEPSLVVRNRDLAQVRSRLR